MDMKAFQILLADDSEDDCFLFEEALSEIPIPSKLKVVHDGEELMNLIAKKTTTLPDVLFLDLNMPRKNGYECLEEIKQSAKLKKLPVVVISTSNDDRDVNMLYKNGDSHYIRKPNEFGTLVKRIREALNFVIDANGKKSAKRNFKL